MMQETRGAKPEQSLGELLSDLTREITTLVRQEAALAKAEMSQKAARVGKELGFLAAGGAVAYAGLLAILAALIVMLDGIMPLWASALLVGLMVGAIGVCLVWTGLNALKREDLAPRQTIETLKEDAQWAREQTRERT
jgi:putative superfamily III holin-X